MEELDFGKRLIEERKAKGLTQEEIAEMCNVTVRTIQRIESGAVKPRAFTIKVISEVLGFDFFGISNTGYDIEDSQNSNLKRRTILWYIKDLFNLKTNAMRKISILTTFCLMIALAVFFSIQETKAQSTQEDKPASSKTSNRPNYIKTKERIEVAFTNDLTFDSLIYIRQDLKSRGLIIEYKKLEFDGNDRLQSIECKIWDEKGKMGGSFTNELLNSKRNERYGFFRDYSANAKTPFSIGPLDD